jgi:putative PIN family toxin of toxin-antitoxin system
MYSIVLDTNVIVAALGSRQGASFAVLRLIGFDWEPLISVPLILEYEAVAKREAQRLNVPEITVDAIIRAFCFFGREVEIYFRLRPLLPDPGDEFLVDLAVAGAADFIVTHNVRHFPHLDRFGIRVKTPGEFLRTMKEEGK